MENLALTLACRVTVWLGQVALLCGEYANELDGLSSFKLDIMVRSGSSPAPLN
jgi:hypothetical protein